MSIKTAPQRPPVLAIDAPNFAVDVRGMLDQGESMAGTPTITEETTDDLLIENVAVSTETLTIDGRSVPAGKAIQFHASGFLAARSQYKIKIVFETDATPPQTRGLYLIAPVVSE